MPYRIRGKEVEMSRPEGWVVLKAHRSEAMAKKHLAALQANVRHTTPRKRK
jgi:hypothetical protein|tara:strand:- start:467 stop:619 length:153 start_codon:yes stop_codon:yes gene_type:complete